MQNSNPTILSKADLPTRQQKSRHSAANSASQYASEIFGHDLLAVPFHDPFAASYVNGSSSGSESEDGDLMEEPIDEQEIYDLIATIADPEHPISLSALAVVSLPDISIQPSLPSNPDSPLRTVSVLITPTITHCSLATVIGLGVRVRLEQSLPPRFRVDVRIKEGTHSTADEVNKQLADKERVAAALENGTLMGVIGKMLETCQ
ncbi:putative cytoplasmic protein required for cell viability [Histoplasma ohiense]|nr:putative cytoplasmic protein required for cell viability [Histoplasma ohiense (nom. inval.)]